MVDKYKPEILIACQYKNENEMCKVFWRTIQGYIFAKKIEPMTIWHNNNGEHLALPAWLMGILRRVFGNNTKVINQKINQIRSYSGAAAKEMGQMPGLFDYGALGDNGLYFLEAKLYRLNKQGKVIKTYMTPEQKEFKKVCESRGISVFEFRTPNEAIEILEQQGTKKKD